MGIEWTEARRAGLRLFCDTIFASVPASADEHGFWARKASDFGVDRACAEVLDSTRYEGARAQLVGVIDACAGAPLGESLAEREAFVRQLAVGEVGPNGAVALLTHIVLRLAYGLPDASGRNPSWIALGYPGPLRGPSPVAKPLEPLVIDRDQVLDTDVCVIGSGAGGGVIADELARRGHSVLVIEAGGYFNEADFNQQELWAYEHLYWRGGTAFTSDGNVRLLAGGALGGGTLVNWENCVRTPSWVRHDWAQLGLDGVDGAGFDRLLDGVLDRLHANSQCNELNGAHQRLEAGARALGYRYRPTLRNVDPERYDPELAGYHAFGDVGGSRRSTVNTYLAAAHARGARIVVRAHAERIVTQAGRATGVEVTATGPDGAPHQLRIRARHVVCACGGLETPALLLRSGIGGPAAGHHLHVQPVLFLAGIYAEDQRAWWGPPQSLMVDELIQLDDGHGILFECGQYNLATVADSVPWTSALAHKAAMIHMPRSVAFLALIRDRGHGRVTLDDRGNCATSYAVTDPRDQALLHRALRELVQLHLAAGARYVSTNLHGAIAACRRDSDIAAFVARLQSIELGARGHVLYSSHHLGSARLGRDPRDSVAQPTGELHDTRGVWIGDTSAFPTALGVNPMITCMALALRTAEHLASALA